MRRTALAVLGLAAMLASCAEVVTDIPEYGSITVTATRRNGDPVPGADAVVYIGARPMGYGVTGADGTLEFRFLPPNQYGVYANAPEGYVRPEEVLGGPTTAVVDGLALDQGGHQSASFTYLKVGDGSVTTRVTAPDGTPIEGAGVELYNSHGFFGADTTGADGIAHFEAVPFGNWGVRAVSPRGYFDTIPSLSYQDGLLVEEDVDAPASLHFEPCRGTIATSVRDGSGSPVQDFPVEVYSASGTLGVRRTAADGVATAPDVPCGEYGVRLMTFFPWQFPEGPGGSFVDGLRIHEGTLANTVFSVTRCVGRVRVRVLDGDDHPVPGTGLTFYDSQHVIAEASTDAQGEHVFPDVGCNAETGVRIRPPSGYVAPEGRGGTYLDGLRVSDGEERVVTFRLAAR